MISFDHCNASLAPQDSLDSLKSRGRLREVLEHKTQENMVKVRVVKGQLEDARLVKFDMAMSGSLYTPARLFEGRRRNVNRHNARLRVPRSEENRLRPRAASALQNRAPRRVLGVLVEQFA